MSADVFVRGSGTTPPTSGRRRWTGPLLALVVVVAVTLLVYEPPSTDVTFDPASRGPGGLAVLVDVLDELGVDVAVDDELPAADRADVVVAPPLGWTTGELLDLARGGVRVVAAVPPGEDAEQVALALGGVGLVGREPACPLLADVATLRSPTWVGWSRPTDDVVDRCIVEQDAAWLTVVTVGDGTVVSLGTFAPLVNDRMRDADTAVAAVRMLDVGAGARVVVLTEPAAQTTQPTLVDLVDRRWFDAAWLTLLVLVLAAVARGRRLGRPVGESLPVRVPSGELARALGDLRHRIGANDAAAEELRARTLATVGVRLGIGRTPSGEEAVAAIRAAGIDLADADADVLRRPVAAGGDADSLTRAARSLAAVRAAVRAGAGDRHDGLGADHRGRADPTPATTATSRPEQP